MYQFKAENMHKALILCVQTGSEHIACGAAVLDWNGIYGCVDEYRQGTLVTRHFPQIDYATSTAGNWTITGWKRTAADMGISKA